MATPSPIIFIAGKPYTANGSIIAIPGHTLTWRNGTSIMFTLDPAQGPQTVSIATGGNPILVNNIAQTSVYTPPNPPPTPAPKKPSKAAATPTTHSSAHAASPSHTSPLIKAPTSRSSSSTSTPTPTTVKNAQQTANSTASQPSQHASPSDGISKGATAGIAIGCAAAGALLAALLVFLLVRKRRYRPSSIREYSPDPAFPKETGATTSPVDATPTVFTVAERELPQPPEDMAIGGEISKLQTLIKNFTQSYYDTSPVAHATADLTELGSVPIPTAALAAMLADPKSRPSAIRYCLMWTITSRIALDCGPRTSLLPPEIMACLSAMPASQNQS
ncbi:MAG: hypothetical protein Q9191_007495, partial [Dirinaria sp. TL-2023a]